MAMATEGPFDTADPEAPFVLQALEGPRHPACARGVPEPLLIPSSPGNRRVDPGHPVRSMIRGGVRAQPYAATAVRPRPARSKAKSKVRAAKHPNVEEEEPIDGWISKRYAESSTAGCRTGRGVSLDPADLIPSAVLLPITDHGGPHVVFAKKSDAVPHHKGHFPGGVCEAGDASRVETALPRGVGGDPAPSEAVEVLGLLDDTATRATPFIITPVVGIVREPVRFEPDGREIERVIEVPLTKLRDPAIFHSEVWERGGEPHVVLLPGLEGRRGVGRAAPCASSSTSWTGSNHVSERRGGGAGAPHA